MERPYIPHDPCCFWVWNMICDSNFQTNKTSIAFIYGYDFNSKTRGTSDKQRKCMISKFFVYAFSCNYLLTSIFI